MAKFPEQQPPSHGIEKQITSVPVDRGNPTARHVHEAITQSGGKIPFSRFMDISLYGPDGYYSAGKARISEGRGFRTHPESSALFGATVGKAAKKVWEAMDRPETFQVVEMGAGNGTMAKDMLVWAREAEPDFYDALHYTIVEYGDMIRRQKMTISGMRAQAVRDYHDRITPEQHERDFRKVEWVQGSAIDLQLQDVEGVFISNELLDAFPVDVVKTIHGTAKQKYVTVENDQWVELWDAPSEAVTGHMTEFGITVPEGEEVAINPEAVRWQRGVNAALKRGAVITIDYVTPPGATGPAVRTYPHTKDTFASYTYMGAEDMTSDVAFDIQMQAAQTGNLQTAFYGTQGEFLLTNGIGDFVAPLVTEMRQTRSLSRFLKLNFDITLVEVDDLVISKGSKAFDALVLTKGVDLPTPVVTDYKEVIRTGFKLNFGRPQSVLHILETDTFSGEEKEYNLTSDAEGFVSFDTNAPYPPAFLTSLSTLVVSDDGGVILNTQNTDALRQVVEHSGYAFDLST